MGLPHFPGLSRSTHLSLTLLPLPAVTIPVVHLHLDGPRKQTAKNSGYDRPEDGPPTPVPGGSWVPNSQVLLDAGKGAGSELGTMEVSSTAK